ncbi:MAG: glycosyltransferase family 2 protein [Solirubrobacterales bacterium]|nr:glycosyltransferase family 2 protein [Solirubrobacterales bacterium]
MIGVEPTASIIVVSFRGSERLPPTLRALSEQDTQEPFEVILVASGDDNGWTASITYEFPWVSIVSIPHRLRPGPARNVGVQASSGRVIAFAPDDGIPRRDWLRRRVALHAQGAEIVGGSITNADGHRYIQRVSHLHEYAALAPHTPTLQAQAVPHAISYVRTIYDTVGPYPEDVLTGEDTLFNTAAASFARRVEFDGDIQMGHPALPTWKANLRHQVQHGRGLMQCTLEHGLLSTIGLPTSRREAAWRCLAVYPSTCAWKKWQRGRRQPMSKRARDLMLFAGVFVLAVATGLGALREWNERPVGPEHG